MAKPRFFIPGQLQQSVTIAGADARHIRDVLRLEPGAVIEVVDSQSALADVKIEEVTRESVVGTVIAMRTPDESLPQVALFQGLPKAGKFDGIVRQATEVGVSAVYPVLTERVIVRLTPDKAEKKGGRWHKIAEEAAKQSHRTVIPYVSDPLAWEDAVRELKAFDQVIVFWEEERDTLLFEVLQPSASRIAVVIGPEGGLTEREVADLTGIGAGVVTLGESILRTETAGPVAVALTLYELRRARRLQQLSSR